MISPVQGEEDVELHELVDAVAEGGGHQPALHQGLQDKDLDEVEAAAEATQPVLLLRVLFQQQPADQGEGLSDHSNTTDALLETTSSSGSI